jgi:hypothetical protein
VIITLAAVVVVVVVAQELRPTPAGVLVAQL